MRNITNLTTTTTTTKTCYTGRWPEKSVKVILGLLQNLAANAAVRMFLF
jgi:ribosomal protein L22